MLPCPLCRTWCCGAHAGHLSLWKLAFCRYTPRGGSAPRNWVSFFSHGTYGSWDRAAFVSSALSAAGVQHLTPMSSTRLPVLAFFARVGYSRVPGSAPLLCRRSLLNPCFLCISGYEFLPVVASMPAAPFPHC